jgi:hypothetical protein
MAMFIVKGCLILPGVLVLSVHSMELRLGLLWRLSVCISHLQLQGLGYSHFDLLGYSHILQGLGYSYKVGVAWGMGSSNLYLPNRSSLIVS